MKKFINAIQFNPLIIGAFIGAAAIFISSCNSASQVSNNKTKTDMEQKNTNNQVWVRYIVTDVAKTVEFYKDLLGFEVVMQASPGFAQLSLGNLNLLVNKPGGGGGAGQSMPDGQIPAPGGWNRIQIRVENLEETVKTLKSKNAVFKNELIVGNGGKQILLLDPSENLVELFEPSKQK